ncbi:type VI secretion system-associated FHA domain protein TagH [Undibacterium sp. CY18W]|uniref:Type VI secretion system-associated FHA domain protein TagH n=1 Tax=Undibacterium hunanense TaxID=2762292 RepID=A0ABR6ZLT4_9BURK|nr:type VI secretion system-associated FHA domain protein TagH [Undibacterium hunanense]MBC3916878.1 type VI secretion system-associated FHA domain protein TagH [Undibacterium hunanense]
MIKIAVVSYNNEAPATSIFAVFGTEQETIGRNEENFLSLPDPRHFVSRTQAKVWSTGGKHFLHNLSLANPILVNGKEIQAEFDHEIHDGDEIQIGLYALQAETIAEIQEEDVVSSLSAIAEVAEVAQVAETEVNPAVADNLAPGAQTEELKPNISSPARTPSGKLLPDVPLPQFLQRPADAAEVAGQPGVPVTVSESPAPAVQTATPAKPQAAPRAENNKPPASNAELMQAFLNGAGLAELSISSGLTVELMDTLGKLMASSVQGAMDELSQRALLKREVKAEVTMVVLRENNPLKFFPDSKTVLTQMLRKKMPGFMAPAEAMEDAFFDIRAHQMGVAAGTHAVTEAILEALQPSSVEQHLNAPGLLEQAMPARRKAALWDQFNTLFETIYAGRKDEFQALFGKEFLTAYEKEVERAEASHLTF